MGPRGRRLLVLALVAWAGIGIVLLVLRDDAPPSTDALSAVPAEPGWVPEEHDPIDPRAGEAVAEAPRPPEPGPGLVAPPVGPDEEAPAFWYRYLAPPLAGLKDVPAPQEAGARLARDPGELLTAVEQGLVWAQDPRRPARGTSDDFARHGAQRLRSAVSTLPQPSPERAHIHAWLARERVAVATGLTARASHGLWQAALLGLAPLPAPAVAGVVDALFVPDGADGQPSRPHTVLVDGVARVSLALFAPPFRVGDMYDAGLVLTSSEPEAAAALVEAAFDARFGEHLAAGRMPGACGAFVGLFAAGQWLHLARHADRAVWGAALARWVARWPLAFLALPGIAAICRDFAVDPTPFLAVLETATEPQARAGLLSVISTMEGLDLVGLIPTILATENPDLALLVARRVFTDPDVPRTTKRDLVMLALQGPVSGRDALKLLPHVVVRIEDALPALDRLLQSPVEGMPARAADALMSLATVPTIRREDVLRHAERLADSRDRGVRLGVVRHLGQVVELPADRAVVERLLARALGDRDAAICRVAADSLGWMAQRDEGLRPIFARHRPHADAETDELLAAWMDEFGEHDAEVAEEAGAAAVAAPR